MILLFFHPTNNWFPGVVQLEMPEHEQETDRPTDMNCNQTIFEFKSVNRKLCVKRPRDGFELPAPGFVAPYYIIHDVRAGYQLMKECRRRYYYIVTAMVCARLHFFSFFSFKL